MRWFYLCLAFFGAFAAEQSICLNMIVKNESPVIERCLQSVKPFIDYWVIVDTGSTDGTQDIIRNFLKDIPGELHEQPWVNFGHNRNEALKLAKGKASYVLFIDADETFEGYIDKDLKMDLYLATTRVLKEPLMTFQRAFLIDNRLDWQWQSPVHEKLTCSKKELAYAPMPHALIAADTVDGNRAQDPQKYLKDALTLEKALENDPNNSEYVFYLAQSYANANQLELALKNYEKRANMQGWDQQTFWSKFFTGILQEELHQDSFVFMKSYCDAFQFRPTRAEPIYRMADHFYRQKNYILSYILAQFGLSIPVPDDIMYVKDWMYSYGMLAAFGNSATMLGKKQEAIRAFEEIAKNEATPLQTRENARDCCQTIRAELKLQNPTLR